MITIVAIGHLGEYNECETLNECYATTYTSVL